MELLFRQGIIRHQVDVAGTANFIRKSGNGGDFIDLICDNGPIIFTFAHGTGNYLIEIPRTVPNAWGPLVAHGQTQHLYWDISLLDASLTYGYTKLTPYTAPKPPINPVTDLHWFDKTSNLMKVWNGTKWIVKLRVFAAVYDNNAILVPRQRGTQVGLNTKCSAGSIIFGKNNYPLHDSDGTFVTSESTLVIGHTTGETVRFDTVQLYAEVLENIPKYSFISYVSPQKVQLSSYLNDLLMVNGMMVEDYDTGEVGNVLSHGLIRNEQWNFSNADINKPIFTGQHGEVTIIPPPIGVSQQLGFVYDNDAIYLNIQQPILM